MKQGLGSPHTSKGGPFTLPLRLNPIGWGPTSPFRAHPQCRTRVPSSGLHLFKVMWPTHGDFLGTWTSTCALSGKLTSNYSEHLETTNAKATVNGKRWKMGGKAWDFVTRLLHFKSLSLGQLRWGSRIATCSWKYKLWYSFPSIPLSKGGFLAGLSQHYTSRRRNAEAEGSTSLPSMHSDIEEVWNKGGSVTRLLLIAFYGK